MTKTLPALPSLEQLKRQAKDLVKQFRAGDPEAGSRVHSHLPRAAGVPMAILLTSRLTLSEAQLVLAREYDFPSWPRLTRHIETSHPDESAAVEAFKRAVRDRDSSKLKTLLRTHPALKDQIDAPLFLFDSPAILRVADHRDRKMMDVLLKYGADINARSQWWAGGFGVLPQDDPEFAAYLIERGAIVDVWAAAGMNRMERLQELIREDPALVNARGGDGQSPLHFAGSIEVARFLLDHGAEIDLRDIDHGSTPAQYMAANRPEVCRYLLSRGAELDIFMAVQLRDIDLVRQVLGADPDSINARVGEGKLTSGVSHGGHIYLYTLRSGRSPLDLATELGHEEIRQVLLAHSSLAERLLSACLAADETTANEFLAQHPDIVRSLPPEQMRLIADAAWAHKTDSIRLMLKIGFDIEARGDHESTALNRAAVRGFADLIELLLARGASLEAKNEFGGGPLSACIWGAENFRDPDGDYVASVEMLIAGNAPVSDLRYPCDNKPVNAVLRHHLEKLSRTNIVAAIKLGNLDRVTSLLDRDSGLVNQKTYGLLPLYAAVRANQVEIVRLLLARGADPSLTQEPGGPTVLDEAVKGKHAEIADLIRARQ
jgi:ankyrin repeat protein